MLFVCLRQKLVLFRGWYSSWCKALVHRWSVADLVEPLVVPVGLVQSLVGTVGGYREREGERERDIYIGRGGESTSLLIRYTYVHWTRHLQLVTHWNSENFIFLYDLSQTYIPWRSRHINSLRCEESIVSWTPFILWIKVFTLLGGENLASKPEQQEEGRLLDLVQR